MTATPTRAAGRPPEDRDRTEPRARDTLAPRVLFRAAACVGRWALFDPAADAEDPDTRRERHGRAVALCATCPCLRSCRHYADTLPAEHRAGVLAGQVRDTRGRPTTQQVAA